MTSGAAWRTDRPQLSTDGLVVYQEAVEGAFGGDVDFAQVVKQYGQEPGEDDERRYSRPVCTDIDKRRIDGNADIHVLRRASQPQHADGDAAAYSTHQCIQQARREALGDGQLYTLRCNSCRIYKTLRVTPAQEIRLDDTVRDCD